MKIPQCNLELYQGNDDIFVLNVEDVDNEGNKTPSNLSGYTFILKVRESPSKPVVLELSSENGYISCGTIDINGNFTEASNGVVPYAIQLHFPHEGTEKLIASRYEYDLFGINLDGIREVLLKGELKVVRSIVYGKNYSQHC